MSGTHTQFESVSVSLAALLRLLVFPLDVVKDVLLTVHQQRLSSHTGDAQWTDGVFVECEALLQSMGPHVLVEYITAGEVQHTAVILVLRNKPDVNTAVKRLFFIFLFFLQLTHTHKLSVSFRKRVGDEADGLQMIHDSMKEFGLLLRLSGEVRMGQQYINITTRLCS